MLELAIAAVLGSLGSEGVAANSLAGSTVSGLALPHLKAGHSKRSPG